MKKNQKNKKIFGLRYLENVKKHKVGKTGTPQIPLTPDTECVPLGSPNGGRNVPSAPTYVECIES